MQKIRLGVALALIGSIIILAAPGCGSSGGSAPGSSIAASPYAGHWTGTWENDTGWGGSLDFTVSSDGRILGAVFDGYSRKTGPASGRIEADGKITASWRYPDEDPTSAAGASRLEGRDQLTATLTGTQAGRDLPPMKVSLLRHYH